MYSLKPFSLSMSWGSCEDNLLRSAALRKEDDLRMMAEAASAVTEAEEACWGDQLDAECWVAALLRCWCWLPLVGGLVGRLVDRGVVECDPLTILRRRQSSWLGQVG